MNNLEARYADSSTDFCSLFRKVYIWLGLSLSLTGLVAWYIAGNQYVSSLILGNQLVFWGLIISNLALVFTLSSAINRLSLSVATLMLGFYSTLNGLVFASIFLIYTYQSIATTFLVTASTFGVMSLYGFVTKKDLSSWGSMGLMSLVGIIIASIANIFLKSNFLYWLITYGGVIIFVGLTAYDTQKIRQMQELSFDSEESQGKIAILGALTLYLDFVNLFLFLLRILGKGKD